MNAAMPAELLRAIARLGDDARRIVAATPAPPKRGLLAPRIRELALDGLDNAAIAAALGIALSTVSQTLSYSRRKMGMAFPAAGRAGAGFLVHLPAEQRARLAAYAKRRGLEPHQAAADLIAAGLAR